MLKSKQFLTVIILTFFSATCVLAQSFRTSDKSPMDMAYFPDNFAHDRSDSDEAIVRVTYSRPYKNDRNVFGGIVPFDKVSRTGANEAPEIKIYKNIKIGEKTLKAGVYALFTIPSKDGWTIIFSSDLDYWGAYSYNEDNDVLRVKAVLKPSNEVIEQFSIQFSDEGKNKGLMHFAWDTTIAEFSFSY
ncbi:MAG: DUF2911 domain-containing protein [Cyclobacteriaceae bacterium]|nr:DUF2911 domain-containing protein [Cyclobacteriaceae bacterium]